MRAHEAATARFAAGPRKKPKATKRRGKKHVTMSYRSAEACNIGVKRGKSFVNAGPGRILSSGEVVSRTKTPSEKTVHLDPEVVDVRVAKEKFDDELCRIVGEVESGNLCTKAEFDDELEKCKLQNLAFARSNSALNGTYEFSKHCDYKEDTDIQQRIPVVYVVCFLDEMDRKKEVSEYIVLLNEKFMIQCLDSYHTKLHDNDQEIRKWARNIMMPYNLSLRNTILFWSIIFHTRGAKGEKGSNIMNWVDALEIATPHLKWRDCLKK